VTSGQRQENHHCAVDTFKQEDFQFALESTQVYQSLNFMGRVFQVLDASLQTAYQVLVNSL